MCLDYCQALYDQWKQPGFYNQNFFHLALLHFICDIHIRPIEIYNLCGKGHTLFLVHLVQDKHTFEKTTVKSLKRAFGECFNPLSFITGWGRRLRCIFMQSDVNNEETEECEICKQKQSWRGFQSRSLLWRQGATPADPDGNHTKINKYLKK